ncbi:MAG: outer membrane protein assembly factor BamD [Myxococcota bacterium]
MTRIIAIAMTLLFAAASPAYAQDSTPGTTAAPRAGVTAAERYDLCLRYFKRGYYTKALETCNRVRNFHRDDPVSVKAELAIADIHYQRGDREQARLAYEDFVRLHPRHESVDYAIYRIGLCWFKISPQWAGRDQTPTRQAMSVWTGFDARFPDSEHREEVTKMLEKVRDRLAQKEVVIAKFYRRRGSWVAVRGRAAGVIDRYEDTTHVPQAMYLVARSWHAWGATAQADQVRDTLATAYPSSRWLTATDRTLAKEPGAPPISEVFLRPYRIPSAGGGGGGGAAAGGGAGGGMPGMGM